MIELRKITADNFDECTNLEVKEKQKHYVASNTVSLAEAYVALTNNECIPITYVIYSNNTIVGFVMLSYNESFHECNENVYWICRLMIDKKSQGKGYSKEAMVKVLELIKTFKWGTASKVYLSYNANNIVAKSLYESLGFIETGEIEDDELIAKLDLENLKSF